MKKKVETNKENLSRAPAKAVRKSEADTLLDASELQDITELILRDHKPLKELIHTMKDDGLTRAEKIVALETFVPLLLAHAKAEEKSLYVQMKETHELRVEGYKGDTEHGIAEQLAHEINGTPDDDEWNAKVKVLAELIEHHIEIEENETLPKVKEQLDLSARRAVGIIYTEFKEEIDILQKPRPWHGSSVVEQWLN